MAEEHQDTKFLRYVIELIVTNPGEVEITRTIDDLGVLITLKVAKEDMGRVIGKDGQTAKAIRTLLRSIGSRNEERINMKILEPEGEEGFTPDAPAAAAPAEEAPEAPAESATADATEEAAPEAPAEEAATEEAPAEEAKKEESAAADEAPAEEPKAEADEAPAEKPKADDDDGIDI